MNRAAIAAAALVLQQLQRDQSRPSYRDDFDRAEPQRRKGVKPQPDKQAKIKAARKAAHKQRTSHK